MMDEKRFRPGTISRPECYLQRAINYSPNDATSYMLYGIFLHRLDHKPEALEIYRRAAEMSPQNPEIKYNMGLLLYDTGNFGEAKKLAQELQAAQFPLQGLQRKLASSGHW